MTPLPYSVNVWIHMAKPRVDKNIQLPENIVPKLLTSSELRMLKNRWLIVQLLEEGLSIRQVAEKAKVGTDTVVRVARMAEKNNLREQSRGKRKALPFKTKTPWIFGKND